MAEGIASSNAVGAGSFEQHLVAAGEQLRRDQIERACEELNEALGLRPGEPRALALLGLAHFRRADFQSALPVYRELVAAAPENASYRLNLGLVHLKLGDAGAAIEELSRSRELDPSQPRTVSYLGLAYARQGLYDRAYQAFLLAGEDGLATEMAGHLSEDARAAIRKAVSEKRPGVLLAPEEEDEEEGAGDAGAGADAADAADAAAGASGHSAGAGLAGDGSAPAPAESTAGAGDSESAFEGERGDEDPGEAQSAAEAGADGAGVEGEPDEGESGSSAAMEDAAALFAPAEAANGADADDEAAGGQAISRAVDEAVPSAAASAAATRAAVGHEPPQPVSELATENLLRPEDGQHAFEIGAGGMLIVRVRDRILSRTEGVIVSGGDLAYEPATRHARGSAMSDVFGGEERPVFNVTGQGQLVARPLGEKFAAVSLDDDILYLREDLVYAFEPSLQWENGYVPGSDSAIPVVQFRGQGSVAIRSRRSPVSIKLMAERVIYVDAEVLAGWIGRVIPRVVAPAAGGEGSAAFVECTGEGVVLIDDPESTVSGIP